MVLTGPVHVWTTNFPMTIAYIKSNALRRVILVALTPLIPVILIFYAAIAACDAFIDEMKDQCGQGGCGLWAAFVDCWNGRDVHRRE